MKAMQDIKFAQSARKHRIGRAHVLHVIETAPYTRYRPLTTSTPASNGSGPMTAVSNWKSSPSNCPTCG
ncbi:MAG: hypothetical protein ACRDSL_11235 [Pseudonocardiaceae bacterium]